MKYSWSFTVKIAEILSETGWRALCDAQWDRLQEAMPRLHEAFEQEKTEQSEAAQDEPNTDHMKGFSLYLDREQWGAVIDGLILERARSDQRKEANPHSNSNDRAQMCVAIIQIINTQN